MKSLINAASAHALPPDQTARDFAVETPGLKFRVLARRVSRAGASSGFTSQRSCLLTQSVAAGVVRHSVDDQVQPPLQGSREGSWTQIALQLDFSFALVAS